MSGKEDGHVPLTCEVNFKVLLSLSIRMRAGMKEKMGVLLVGEAAKQPGCGLEV